MTHSLYDRLRLRAAVLATVREFFVEREYLEVETPCLVPSPGMDVHLDAFEVVRGLGSARSGYLITSPEYQMKRLLCEGIGRIFQLARCFRSGEVGQRHNPEFTMLEWYASGLDYEGLMQETEALVRTVAERHRSGKLWAGREFDVSLPFERVTVTEAFERFADVPGDAMQNLAAHDEERYFRILIERVEPGLASLDRPVFLVDYPASQASLARTKPGDAALCERFELYLGEVELCNGFGELCCPIEQRHRFEEDQRVRRERGLPVYPIDERFLTAMTAGMPESSGNAVGIDRLVAAVAGLDAIGDGMAFPVGRL